MAEMEKRLNKTGTKDEEDSKITKLEQQLAEVSAELDRLKGIDVGITSTRSPDKVQLTEMDAKLRNLAKEVGLPEGKVLERVKERERKGYGR